MQTKRKKTQYTNKQISCQNNITLHTIIANYKDQTNFSLS